MEEPEQHSDEDEQEDDEQNAQEEAAQSAVANDFYLNALDGMLAGEDPTASTTFSYASPTPGPPRRAPPNRSGEAPAEKRRRTDSEEDTQNEKPLKKDTQNEKPPKKDTENKKPPKKDTDNEKPPKDTENEPLKKGLLHLLELAIDVRQLVADHPFLKN
ncbi:hypothetical protein AK812_SmicGene8386 [Symbiodinium microadriaticum]|uniref:Uncharacterized protein n=1 Tax=Symbiodinium microadriaticum TaxID=2951 RepID=A0A1Q9ELA1_SYMMI|nr:hypothetical protein AK812_SmicGene8386 [Symbiodinium microadriaticum]